jgi:type II secretory pathway pseudopilin PulG
MRLHRRSQQGGFSLIELSVVVLLGMILAGMAVYQVEGALPVMRANAAMGQVVSQMRIAREMALAQRRSVQLKFIGTNEIQIERLNQPTGFTNLDPVYFEGGGQFVVFSGQPDTPAGFGNDGAIYFGGLIGGPTAMVFQSDGTFANNANSQPINGTVFVGIPGLPGTARAVTILGATGRVRPYHWNGTQWVE